MATQSSAVIDRDLKVEEEYLLWPQDKIKQLETSENKKNKEDIHMVFEYAEGDQILGGRYTAPRSNRFYFVHDPNGGQFKQLEVYHKLIESDYTNVRRHLFGGYQLLQKLSPEAAEERLSALA